MHGRFLVWHVTQIVHTQLDYIEHIFTDFQELAGDRAFADDKAIVGGLARLDGRSVMIIGHQKGRQKKDKVTRNFGCQHLKAIAKRYA